MSYVLSALLGYLLGCSNLAYFLARARGFDIRGQGSNGAGASNATITMGLKAGVLVALHDVLKAVLAVLLAGWLFPAAPQAALLAGGCAVLGHMFPFYLKCRGGKGFASFLGMILALDWRFFLLILLAAVLITVVTDYIVFATATTVVTFPLWLCLVRDNSAALLLLALSAVILWKHIPNFARLLRGEEIGLRAALRRKNQV